MDEWTSFRGELQSSRPGIVDELLSRCVSGHHNPYRWLARGVSSRAQLVLDLECGTAALGRELAAEGRTVVGLDSSWEELSAATGPGPHVQAEASALPFADESFDAVVSTLGLAMVHPTDDMLDEVCRVLKPGGMFVGLVPTVRPLNARDMAVAAQITRRLLGTPKFPASIELAVGKVLERHGLRKAEDARERYHFEVRDEQDAELLLAGLHLPRSTPGHLADAQRWMVGQASRRDGLLVPVPLRRVVALKPPRVVGASE